MNKIYILLLALLVMAGCYKDKGNYDYKTMYAIEIDGIDENKKYELWFGEPFTMPEPIIRFTDSTQAHDDLSYQWKLDTFVVSTEKCLNVTFGIEPQGWNDIFGAFIVKDERTGISYSQRFRVTLLSNFTNGWMWMTENQGKAELNMLASSKKFFQNVYTAVNNRELGPKAYGVVEHFDAGLNANGVLVMAGGPGSDGPVELDWSNLRKEVWTGEEFVGGSLPEDLQEIKAACMSVILPEGICTRTGIRIFLSTGIISSLLWWGIVSLLIIMSLYFMKKMKEDICFWITESYGD